MHPLPAYGINLKNSADKAGVHGLSCGMFWRIGAVSISLVILCSSGFAAGQPQTLTPDEMSRAAKVDTFTVPTPGELLAALNKQGKPNWLAQFRKPIPTAYTSRAQIALNLGGLLADGYIAVEAEDAQQVKNTGKDIISLAKALGVSQNIISRGNSISEFAGRNDWNALKEELEATQNEVRAAMLEQHDRELAILVSLGGWIRGTEAVSAWVAANYTPESAKLLRQPALVHYLRGKISELPAKVQEEPLVQAMNSKLREMEKLVAFPRDATPSVEDVKKLHAYASAAVREIETK